MQGNVFSIWVVNKQRACWVEGYPDIAGLIAPRGHPVRFRAQYGESTTAGGPYEVRPVELAHGAAAASFLSSGGARAGELCQVDSHCPN